jgi:cobalt-zinc-cadmium efflux system outer membrane protein
MRRSSAIPVVITAGMAMFGFSPAHAQETLSVEQAIRLALRNGAEVRAAGVAVEAAEAQKSNAGILLRHNPSVEAGVGPRTRGVERSLDLHLGLQQPIEIAGQRSKRKQSAAADLNAARARLESQRAALAAEVRSAFVHVLAVAEERKIAKDAVALARAAMAAADDRFRSGAASRIEVNTARVELGRAARAELQSAREHASALADLRLLIGLDAAVPLTLVGDLRQSSSRRSLELGPLITQARQHRSDLAAARWEVESSRAAVSLAVREAVPTPRIGASYGREEDANILLGTLSLDLPLFNRNQVAATDARARLKQAELTVELLDRRLTQEVSLAVQRVETARAALGVFNEAIIKASEENATLATEGYKAGEIDFLQLALLRRDTLEASRGHIEALEEVANAEANLDRVLGVIPTADPAVKEVPR